MAGFTGVLEGLTTSDKCSKKKGVKAAYAASGSLIDWAFMQNDGTYFDQTTQQILKYKYLPGGGHVKMDFDRKSGIFNSTYTRDTGYFDTIFQMVMLGKDRVRTNAIKQYIVNCDLALHLYMNDGTQRVLGIDWDGEAFDKPILKFEVDRVLDTHGELEGDDPRDEIDFGGQLLYPALYANVPRAELDAASPAVVAYGPQANGNTAYGTSDGGNDVYGTVNRDLSANAAQAASLPAGEDSERTDLPDEPAIEKGRTTADEGGPTDTQKAAQAKRQAGQ